MLFDQIQNDLKQSMRDRNELKTSTLRMVVAAAANAKIAKGSELSDEDLLSLIQKEAKQRDEASRNAVTAGRTDLVEKNEQEKRILEEYLPAQLSEEEIRRIVAETITETGATSKADMGIVMSSVMGKLKGQADGSIVSRIVNEQLS